MGIKKRGMFFSLDALIALSVIILVLLIAIPTVRHSKLSTEIHRDMIKSFSTIKIGELNNSYVLGLIASGEISDLNKSVLEQIGEFYVLDVSKARDLANSILSEINITTNIGIWYGDTLIASKNRTSFETAENVEIAKQIISGIQAGGNVTGYSARAYLASNSQTAYYYFGGYVGDGNITVLMNTTGEVIEAEMELVVNNNFNLRINDITIGDYEKSVDEFTPRHYNLPISNFQNGLNKIEFRDDSLHIAGGFIKLMYETNEEFSQPIKHNFPGINGLINIYDGLYIPGNLSTLEVVLHLKTNYTTFLTIGNTTVFRNKTNGEETITIHNSILSTLFDYDDLSKKTIPIRLGLENASYLTGTTKNAFVFSVTDISGSMAGTPLTNAKLANNALIDAILNYSGNKVGLAAYSTEALDSNFHNLSSNNASLKAEVQSWVDEGYTCICCGINKAAKNMWPIRHYDEIDKSLRAYYNFDNNVNDLSGNNNNGALYGGMSCNSVGMNGSSCNFDGSNDYIRIPSNCSIGGCSEGMEELTFAMWVYPIDNTQNRHIAGTTNNWNGDGYNMYLRGAGSSNQRYAFDIDGNYVRIGNIVTNSWTHLAGTYNGTTMVFYINGTRAASSTSKSGAINQNDANLYIGRIYGYSASYFRGRIDDVRIYGGALNSSQIAALARRSGTSCGNNEVETGEVCDGSREVCKLGEYEGWKQCNPSCSGWETCDTTGVCGDGLINQGEECDDNNFFNDDGCSASCELEPKEKFMIVMSDGVANRECAEQNTGNSGLDAIQAACDAYENYGIKVYAVGFGIGADNETLEDIANCGHGEYYNANISEIMEIYRQIAEGIIQATYKEQTINATGNINTILYPDSYIKFNYIRETTPYGLIITTEKLFDNNLSGRFSLPTNSTHIETHVVSYSGPKWTDNAKINNVSFYKLVDYGSDYINLGDPYSIFIPNSLVSVDNNITLTIGISPAESINGSISNKIIYTIAKEALTYSAISAMAQGCNWTIEFEDSTNASTMIPSNYTGANVCYYTSSSQEYNSNDALQSAIYKLLKVLDFNSNNRIDSKFVQNNMKIDSTLITGIPYVWSTEVQIRVWY